MFNVKQTQATGATRRGGSDKGRQYCMYRAGLSFGAAFPDHVGWGVPQNARSGRLAIIWGGYLAETFNGGFTDLHEGEVSNEKAKIASGKNMQLYRTTCAKFLTGLRQRLEFVMDVKNEHVGLPDITYMNADSTGVDVNADNDHRYESNDTSAGGFGDWTQWKDMSMKKCLVEVREVTVEIPDEWREAAQAAYDFLEANSPEDLIDRMIAADPILNED